MINASQLHAGMAITYEGQDYKVVVAEYHPGQGKMGGVTHARLRNLATGTFWEHSLGRIRSWKNCWSNGRRWSICIRTATSAGL